MLNSIWGSPAPGSMDARRRCLRGVGGGTVVLPRGGEGGGMLSPLLAVSGSDDMAFRRAGPKPSMSGSGEPDASRSEPSSTTDTTRSRHDPAQLRPIAATLSERELAGTAIFRLASLAGPSTMPHGDLGPDREIQLPADRRERHVRQRCRGAVEEDVDSGRVQSNPRSSTKRGRQEPR